MLDLTTHKTPEGAAKALHQFLVKLVRSAGGLASEVVLLTPERGEEIGVGKAWRVMWEDGPFEWGVCVSLGGRLHESDYNYAYNGTPEIKVLGSSNWCAEPYYSFDIGFYKN